jgi:hypothetical protein
MIIEYLSSTHTKNPLNRQHIIRAWMMETNYKIEVDKNPYTLNHTFQKSLQECKLFLQKNELTQPLMEGMIFKSTITTLAKIEKETKEVISIDYRHFNPYFNPLIKSLSKIDPFIMDEESTLSFEKLKEILLFVDFLSDIYRKQKIYSYIPQSKVHQERFDARLKNMLKTATLLTNKLCALFNQTLWRRVYQSSDIITFIQNSKHTYVANMPQYLYYNMLIKKERYLKFPKPPKEHILLVSNDEEFFKSTKETLYASFKKLALKVQIDTASSSAEITAIIDKSPISRLFIDYTYSEKFHQNGLKLLQFLVNNKELPDELLKNRRIYLCAEDTEVKAQYHTLAKPLQEHETTQCIRIS